MTCQACGAPMFLCTVGHTDGKGPRLHCRVAFTHDVLLTDLPEADVERLTAGADHA